MNVYTILNARLVAEPKRMTFNGKDFCELRVADNPVKRTDKNGKERKGRFVTLKFWGYTANLAAKLSKGDVIAASGELEIETYESKGETREKDVMAVSNFSVCKSESFYAKSEAPPAEEAPPADDGLPF